MKRRRKDGGGESHEEIKVDNVEEDMEEYAWDDVNDIELPLEKVREARYEEMAYMKGKTFRVVKKEEAYRVAGKKISTKWVDTD